VKETFSTISTSPAFHVANKFEIETWQLKIYNARHYTMNDFEIYKNAALILRTGENVALVTVISTEGSTPGKVGYKMLVWGQKAQTLRPGSGQALGTVGGGLAEAEVIDMAKGILPKPENRVLRFSFDARTGSERGICGGSMEVLVEIFDQKALPLFEDLLAAIENGQKGALISIISPKRAPKKVFLREQQVDAPANLDLPPEAVVSIRSVMDTELPERRTLQGGVEIFIEPVSEEPMVFIFGAGHLSYHICRLAKSVNFRVTVCDDRAEFANQGRFPDADSIVVESFETVFDRIDVTKNSYIVIVTRGHESDQTVLEKAVKTDAKYVGMIGSKRKTLTILKRLQEKGIPRETLRRVYSPIGISIGAVTPQEIALSIVCELTKIRRLGAASASDHMKIGFSKSLGEEKL
jgi:xanthine dehydrogenase accessory factor